MIIYFGPEIYEFMGKTMEELSVAGNYYVIEIQSLNDIYLNSDYTIDIGIMGNKDVVILFSFVALFIIILACINFMNLSTARSSNRSKEVGVRKALGSRKSHLVRQFLIESVLISVNFIFLLGLFLVVLLRPISMILPEKHYPVPVNDFGFILTFIFTGIIVGILAGIYPCFLFEFI